MKPIKNKLGFRNIYYNGMPVFSPSKSLKSIILDFRIRLADWLRPKSSKSNEEVVEHDVSMHNRGRVVKVTIPAEYDPKIPSKKGGHVVKIMPKKLKDIKEAQNNDVSMRSE
jgi:hypothetical protein